RHRGQADPRPEPPRALPPGCQKSPAARRSLTAHLAVTGPRYLPVKVTVTAAVWKRAKDQGLIADFPDVQKDIETRLKKFLHPVHGGPDGKGWQVGQSVFIADLFKAIMPSEDVGFISDLKLEADIPASPANTTPFARRERPFSLQTTGRWFRLADYELVCYSTNSQVTLSPPV